MRRWIAAVALLPMLALTACSSPAAPVVDVTHLPYGVQSPQPDEGSASDRAAVRAALVAALTAEEDQLSRSRTGQPLASPAERSRRLLAVEAAPLAGSDLRAMSMLTTRPADTPFRSARFTVIHWQGVVVRGDLARAYVVGHDVYKRWDGTTVRTPDFQYKAALRHHRARRRAGSSPPTARPRTSRAEFRSPPAHRPRAARPGRGAARGSRGSPR